MLKITPGKLYIFKNSYSVLSISNHKGKLSWNDSMNIFPRLIFDKELFFIFIKDLRSASRSFWRIICQDKIFDITFLVFITDSDIIEII